MSPPSDQPRSEPLESAGRSCLLLLGMHRSGTSAVARACNLLGMDLGSELVPSAPDNPTGFWEHTQVKRINDEVLARLGSAWDDLRAVPAIDPRDEALAQLRARIADLIQREFGTSRLWGIKEPRLSRLVPLWLSVLSDLGCRPRFVIVTRSPGEVVASLGRRNGFGASKSFLLWLRYTLEAERATRGQPRVFVAYEQMLRDWRSTVMRVAGELDIRWPIPPSEAAAGIESFLDPGSRHHRLARENLTAVPAISTWVLDAHDAVTRAAEGDAATISGRLDRIQAELAVADAAFIPLIDGLHEFIKLLVWQAGDGEGSSTSPAALDSRSPALLAGSELVVDRARREVEAAAAAIARKDEDLAAAAATIARRDHELSAATATIERRDIELDAAKADRASKSGDLATRDRELIEARHTVQRHEAYIHLQGRRLRETEEVLQGIVQSRSWRYAAPLRSAAATVRQLLGRGEPTSQPESVPAASRRTNLPERRSVLFLSGCPGDAKRYRANHQAEQLEAMGVSTSIAIYGEDNLGEALERHACFILHRVPYGPDVENFIALAKKRGCPVLFDTDDWVFDLGAARHVAALDDMSQADRLLYLNGLKRYRETLRRCDAVLVSTAPLADLAKELVARVAITPNRASQEMLDLADQALLERPARPVDDGSVTIAYLSGTPTHKRDFGEAVDALVWALETYPQARLLTVGHLELPPQLAAFRDRLRHVPLIPWHDLPRIYATVDIHLAPLERDNEFAQCKSSIKYIEAGLLGVPTIASPTPDFRRAIRHGENGFLAGEGDEWKTALGKLIESRDLRLTIGHAAFRDVREHHVSRVGAVELHRTIEGIVTDGRPAAERRRSRRLTVNWVLRAPIATTGGGYRTIFQLARALVERGHVVRTYVEPIGHLEGMSEPQVRAFVGEHFDVQGIDLQVGHDDIQPAEVSIATNWPTAFTVAEHPSSLFRFYFVQDFEPEFYELDDPLHRQAERTYHLPLRHVCIGRHLAGRLQKLTGRRPETIDFAIDSSVFKRDIEPEHRPGPVRVLFFARPGMKRRGYELGIEALALLKQRRPEVEVWLFGASDGELGALPFSARNLGVLSHVELARALNQAHILLSFSLSSNISWVPLQGMACGCAVVEANLPSVADMVSAGDDCLLVEPERDHVAAGLTTLVDDQRFRVSLARKAADMMTGRTWANSARQFEEILLRNAWFRLWR